MAKWTAADIPAQRGRVAVVTGTGGLGLETAVQLARAGAEVIVAGRNAGKGDAALATIRAAAPQAKASFELLDLADLASIAAFADRLTGARPKLDLLVNNAAVMAPPSRRTTGDGFELQFGTNYLGPFALTGRLLPLLRRGDRPRVVTVSSIAAADGTIRFEDLQTTAGYRPMSVYGQSKLADLMFAFELQRRSDSAGWGLASIAAHPGISATDLIDNGAGRNSLMGVVRRVLGPIVFQPVARGALPTLYAATAPEAQPGGYYGPDGIGGIRGFPAPAKAPPRSLDTGVAARLWDESERLTGVTFGAAAVAA